ncbi:hypothetical protein CL614_05430 [archaeon]|nr:hypothetical protein [archaeon]
MKKLVIIFFLAISCFCNAQDTCFTETEVINISNHIDSLEYLDSVKTELLREFKGQMQRYKALSKQDKLISSYQDTTIDLLKQQINQYQKLYAVTKPKWYESKIVWFGLGVGTILTSSWVVKNIK